MQRMFRRFAEAGGNDLAALAACIRGSRQSLTADEVGRIGMPSLVAVGTKDAVAGDPNRLAALLPAGEVLDIPGPRPQSGGRRQGLSNRAFSPSWLHGRDGSGSDVGRTFTFRSR